LKTLLVIPTYNDSERLSRFLPQILSALPPHFHTLIFDDGSHEGEKTKLEAVFEENQPLWAKRNKPLELKTRKENCGKGASIQEGWSLHPDSDLFGFVDADGAVGGPEILRAEQWIRESPYEALFGSRVQMLHRTIKRSLKRHISSRVFATIVHLISNSNAYDTQCGLKFLKKTAYEKIHPHFQSKRFAFDVELTLLLQHFGIPSAELPIDWEDVPGSKVHLFRDSLLMAKEVFQIHKRVQKIPKDASPTPPPKKGS